MKDIFEYFGEKSYPGRGIVIGCSEGNALFAYFIMGRSENSRNRVFRREGDGVTIYPFDPAKLKDPSLVIYSPVRTAGNKTVVTNGDQTDTVYDGIMRGESFASSLMHRRFEPDAPNFTPRISGIVERGNGGFTYALSILKSADADGSACERTFFNYEAREGVAHAIHTYSGNSAPLPSFSGEPPCLSLPRGLEAETFAQRLWAAVDPVNRVALCVRIINASTGAYTQSIINSNAQGEEQ